MTVPARLQRNNRPVVAHFDDQEVLWWWVQATWSFSDDPPPPPGSVDWFKALVVETFHWPDQSFNRSSQSEADDVLIGQDPSQCSIVGFPVSAVRKTFTVPRDKKHQNHFEVDVEHVPLEANYAHSELAIEKNGARLHSGEARKVTSPARNQIAARIASAAALEPSP